jgi:hypothetical protein
MKGQQEKSGKKAHIGCQHNQLEWLTMQLSTTALL